MAKGTAVLRASPAIFKRELDPRDYLPYARHVNERVIALDSRALMVCFRLDGVSFQTADLRDINDWHVKLNGALRNIADDKLALWTHTVRREDRGYPEGAFRSAFARRLDERYRERVARTRLFVNELYLTLVLHPGSDPADKLSSLLNRLGTARKTGDEVDADAVRRLEDAALTVEKLLGRYGVQPLGVYEHRKGRAGAVLFSEPMELLHLLLTGRRERMALVEGHLGAAVYTDRVIFGRESLEIRDAGSARFAGMFGIKEYPATTWPGLWDDVLRAKFPFVLSQSFAFLSKAAARAVMERKQNQMTNSLDRAFSQIEGLDHAIDEMASGRFVMGDHQFSMLVYGDTIKALAEHMSQARSLLADSGMVVAREDLALEAAFWSQFPGNFSRRARPAAITSRNFAGLSPFHTYPSGRPEGNHWGSAVALLRTSAMSPYYFNFHMGDLGHTFICGPSGTGKTVVQTFMLAQLEKADVQQVLFDKDRGAEIFVRACGGTYLPLKNGVPTGFAPFKALELTPSNTVFLGQLVRRLVTPAGGALTVQQERSIDDAIQALRPFPRQERSLAALRGFLGQRDPEGIGARLEKWCEGGALGWVLDNDADAMRLDARFLGFDMTDFLDNPEIRTPLMMYLFHRIADLVDGRRLVVVIDEFWKALNDDAFRSLAQDGLKTYRKQNAMMVFGTQSPADVLRSPISHTIVENCPTKIFFPNPYGTEKDYVQGFGLTQEEFRQVREELSPESRQFLVKQGHNSVVVELNLNGLDDELAVLSGRTETVELLDRVRQQHGDDPAVWGPVFHDERRRLR